MIKQFRRVKQIADQKFQRNDRSGVLTDELSAAEKRVDLIKESCCAAGKKLSACVQRLAPDATTDRRNGKKLPEAALAQCLEEWGLSLGESSILGLTLVDYARIQDTLASDLLLYKLQVEENVVEPLQNILNNDMSKILKYRKQLFKLTSELDSTRSKYLNAQKSCQQATGNGSVNAAAKAQLLKEETDDMVSKVEQCRDSLTAEMFNLISREPEMSELFLKLCQLQLEYHRKSFYLLESALPEIETQIRCCAYQPVFGIPLEEHLRVSNREIAIVIESCVCWLLDSALEEEGLFRIGGSMIKIKKIKSAFDASFHHLLEEEKDPHNVAGVLKLYLRSLPDPLLTYYLYDQWMEAAGETNHDARLRALWNVVNSLPESHFKNLRYLIKFLAKLCQNADVNKMSIQNVAIVIGPNLLWPPVENSALGMNMTATNLHSSIVDTLITYSEWFFPGECEFFVSTPTSPRHLTSFSLSSSQLSLAHTKLSNGDSALESMSSSPTNSSPKSPSPHIPLRPRKKAAPRAPLSSTKNAISRSLSCGGFQANLLSQAVHNKTRHSTLCVSHENLLNATFHDAETDTNPALEEELRVVERPKSRPKPPRSHRNGLPPHSERRSIGRPTVPPPERPDSFSTSGSMSTDISSTDSEKVLDLEDISISLDSSGSESYNECQMSFMDDSDNEIELAKTKPLNSQEISSNLSDGFSSDTAESIRDNLASYSSDHSSPITNDSSSSKEYQTVLRDSSQKQTARRLGSEKQHVRFSSNGHVSIEDISSRDTSQENREFFSETSANNHNNFPGHNSHFFEDTNSNITKNDLEDVTFRRLGHNYSNDCHFVGGTPTWFDHYGDDLKQSNTLWFTDPTTEKSKNCPLKAFPEESVTSVDYEENCRTIIEVGNAKNKSITVSGTSIKLRVNSQTEDTKL